MGAKARAAGGDDGAGVEHTYRLARQLAKTTAASAAVRRAAAVVLHRERDGALELFAVRRSPDLAFLGGYWSLPGGAAAPGESPEEAARRELAEETGVILDPSSPLEPLGVWTTPPIIAARFETSYFAAALPEAQTPDASASGGELDAGEWVTPAAALERATAGQWLFPWPIRRVLEGLTSGHADEGHAARIWNLAGAIDLTPLRTPTLPPATHTNCYLVGASEMVIVDPATPYDDERAAIDQILGAEIDRGRRPVAIWLTHHHGDHVGDAARLADRFKLPIAAHPETARRLAGSVPVTAELADGQRLELAGSPPRALRCVFTPGHAPGHLCFLEEHTQMLIAGDMVAGVGTILVDPAEGDMADYLESLARMRALGARRLLPAHGPVIADPVRLIDSYVAHRLWREHRVRAALEAAAGPATAAALVPAAYADVAPALYPLAERSLVAHLVKLERDGAARRSGDLWSLRRA